MPLAFMNRRGEIRMKKYQMITGCISILAVTLLGICIVQGYVLNRMKETSISGIADSYQNFRTLMYNAIHRYQNEDDTHIVGASVRERRRVQDGNLCALQVFGEGVQQQCSKRRFYSSFSTDSGER